MEPNKEANAKKSFQTIRKKENIKNQSNILRVEQRDMPLNPGMTAQAEVKTGKRHIIEFFLPGIEEVKDGFEVR